MTLRCPVCRAENATGPACRRCRADLSLLAAVEARRDFHLARARAALRKGDPDTATAELTRAEALNAGSDTRRLRAIKSLLKGDFATALTEHWAAAG